MPWIFDDFPHVGYYEHDTLPPQLDADFLLVQEAKVQEVEAQMHDSYFTDWMTLRSFQEPSKIYFNTKMFKGTFPDRPPDFIGHAARP